MGKTTQRQLLEELDDIRKKENEVLNKINLNITKEALKKKKTYLSVTHLSFNDFAQILIGCCVFGLPTFINTSFWDYIPLIQTHLIVIIHLFFGSMVLLALNYEFQDNFALNAWFAKNLFKRFFYTYFSVFMIVFLMLLLVNKVGYTLTNLEVFRNMLVAQSIGLFGAITFTFLKK